MTTLTPQLADYSYQYPGEIGLQVKNGIVTLTGAARNPRTKARAIADAEGTRGVIAVIDRMIVTPPLVSDEELKQNVQAALHMDPSTSSYKIQVKSSQGKVTLTGALNSPKEKALATWVAEGVDGVRSVQNQIQVPAKGTPPDAVLVKLIKEKFRTDSALYDSPIEVKASRGQIYLIGRVGSVVAQQKAIQAAWGVNPASVDALGLRVDPSLLTKPGNRERAFKISDFDIWNIIASTFHDDPRLSQFQPHLSVKGGIVILSGNVDSFIAKHAAVEDTSLVRGVIEVQDELSVQGSQNLSDSAIAEGIRQSIFLHSRNSSLIFPSELTRGE